MISSFRIPDETALAIDRAIAFKQAKTTRRISRSAVIREAVKFWLDRGLDEWLEKGDAK